MQINRLDKLFGPSGSFGGIIILITGLAVLYYSWTAIFLVLIGGFAAFTCTTAIIDYKNRRVKYATTIFGLFHIGHWINVVNGMSVRVRQSGRCYAAYSRSNRALDLEVSDYSIILRDTTGHEICPLNRFKSRPLAESQIVEISERLEIQITT